MNYRHRVYRERRNDARCNQSIERCGCQQGVSWLLYFFHKKKSNCLNSSDIFLCFPDGRVKNLQKIITFLPGKTVP